MLKLAAMALVAASTTSSPGLLSNSSWWERVTMTMSGDGNGQSCRFETSLAPSEAKSCEVTASRSLKQLAGRGSGVYTRISFERRFSPGNRPELGELQPGDTMLGSQVMALSIDGSGAVRNCKVLLSAGSLLPSYGCREVRAERFAASAAQRAEAAHEGYMTIIVYGHSAQLA